MTVSPFQSTPPIPAEALVRPKWGLPQHACDAHMHVFGPPDRYPPDHAARYTTPPAPLSEYRQVAVSLGLERAVFVQPSFYGEDNSCLLEALAHSSNARGVVMASVDTPRAQLLDWHAQGVRGLRVDLFKAVALGQSIQSIRVALLDRCELAASLGWSVDLYVPGSVTVALVGTYGKFPCPVSIAHMGYLDPSQVSDRQCSEFLAEVEASDVWMKISGIYRYGTEAGYGRAIYLLRELLARVPDRLLWGSDWPHVMSTPQDSGSMLNLLHDRCHGDNEVLCKILVANPARLYGW